MGPQYGPLAYCEGSALWANILKVVFEWCHNRYTRIPNSDRYYGTMGSTLDQRLPAVEAFNGRLLQCPVRVRVPTRRKPAIRVLCQFPPFSEQAFGPATI